MVKRNGSDIKILQKPNQLKIVYSNTHTEQNLTVYYRLRDNSFVSYWVERLNAAKQRYPIDDPCRFYGIGDNELENSINKINSCIQTINSHRHIIKRSVTNPIDVDTVKQKMIQFYQQNKNFFDKRKLSLDNFKLRPGRIPIADLDSHGKELLQLLIDKQFVKSVDLI